MTTASTDTTATGGGTSAETPTIGAAPDATMIDDAASSIPAQYDPAATEAALYAQWDAAGVFTADAARSGRSGGDRTPFVVLMPPPNVTAVLHVGHGLNNTVQDVVVRWRRMAGDETLWLVGTDHAGIATQNVVEKQLAREGTTRQEVGRDAFVARTAEFVRETGGTILQQLRAIGASADWTRTAYTLSPELSRAVREAFVRLHERGLVYRGHRVIHWCPRCLTSLSDEEAEHTDTAGALYHIAYQVAGEPGRTVVVATTRPETMLGDVAVAVHPDDARYADLVGRMLVLPINGTRLPVIADLYADPAFGSGAVKITPAHDPNDFEVGKRHGLAMPVVMTPDGRMQDGMDSTGRVPESLRGVDRFEARTRIVALLEDSGALVRREAHQHSVRHCYRCDTVVEPRLSDQWFVRMEPLARPALAAVRDGRLRILPERWEAVYVHWLDGIRDWNISRQLWWGHRIPVWYCDSCGEVTVSREDIAVCPKCTGAVRQDEDVLDTWFSSWLWPLSTLGWPDAQAPDLKAFYPSDVLITAPEILFFWVARMVMAGYAFAEEAPFHTVYLHGTVRDTNHVKMSKSLGNGIDPLEVVRLYGADAMRYTLIAGMGMGADVILDPTDLEKSFATGRNFATKLWNIGRFLLMKVGSAPVRPLAGLRADELRADDWWMLQRIDAAITEIGVAFGPAHPDATGMWNETGERSDGLRLNEYAEVARRLVWNELADWYLEAAKARLAAGGADAEVARAMLVHAFDVALRLLHPIVPFITEALWQRLPGHVDGEFIARAAWPVERGLSPDERRRGAKFDAVRAGAVAVRQLRSMFKLPPGKLLDIVIAPAVGSAGSASAAAADVTDAARTIGHLARATVRVAIARPEGRWVPAPTPQMDVFLRVDADVAAAGAREVNRVRTELEGLEKQLGALRGRLANEGFVTRAKPEIVEAERVKERDWTARREQLAAQLASLGGE